MIAPLPNGTVTFLFTDIEGSTSLWEHHPQAMSGAVARHHAILREAIEANQGQVFNIVGDAFCAAFATAQEALAAALAAQRALSQADWGLTPIRVRMGLHTGEAEADEGDYRPGPTLNRVARVMSIAHGGQTLLSQIAAGLVRRHLPDGIGLRDMGEHRLKGLSDLERILQVVAPDLPLDFPPLKSLCTVQNNVPAQRLLARQGGAAGDHASALQLFAGAAEHFQQVGDKNLLSFNARFWGHALVEHGDLDGARSKFQESLRENWEIGDKQGLAACLSAFGALALAQRDLPRAARLLGASADLSEAIHTDLMPDDQLRRTEVVAALRAQLEAPIFDAAWAEG
ncbi:MAG: adenylate/guanylate cyclase domain-containing protein, partial [Spirochaetia bacterium]